MEDFMVPLPSQSTTLLPGQYKDLCVRDNKELVFVSFKNFDRDISPSIISSWMKQLVLLCYKFLDKEVLLVHKVK